MTHVDICGPYSKTIGGNHYMLFAVDAASGCIACYALRRKSLSEVLPVFKKCVVDMTHKAGTPVKCIREDCDALWTSRPILDFCATMNIAFQYSPPGVQQYNGVAESAIQRCFKGG